MAAWNSIIYIRTSALHSFLSFEKCRAASTVIPLLPKATFTPSIQPNLGLPRISNTILSTCSIISPIIIILNTLWPSHSARQLPFYSSSSFLILFIRDTLAKFLKTFRLKIHFTSLSTSHTPCLCSIQRRWYNYSFILTLLRICPQSFIAQHTFRAPHSL